MFSYRLWLCVLASCFVASAVRAQAVNLTEAPLEKRCVRNELTMELEGKIIIRQEDKEHLPAKASASTFSGTLSAERPRRHHRGAALPHSRGNGHVQQRRDDWALRPDAGFWSHRTRDQLLVYSPHGR